MPDPIASSTPRGAPAPEADTCELPPPDDLVSGSDASAPSSMPPVAEHPFFDYVTLSLGVGAVIGASLSATVDREGHVYLSAALGVGFGPTIGTVSLVAGHLLGEDDHRGRGSSVPSVIEGASVNANVAYGPSVGITSYPGGLAVELGVGTPQFGACFEHAWEINGPSGGR